MGRKRRIKAANKRQTEDFSVLLEHLNEEEDELQKLLKTNTQPTYSRCNPNHDHARACGPYDGHPDQCHCGCTFDGTSWCISAQEFFDRLREIGITEGDPLYSEDWKKNEVFSGQKDWVAMKGNHGRD